MGQTPIPENSVVVGVDGTERDREVVRWAAGAALRRGVGLHAIFAQEAMATAYAPLGLGLDAPLVTQAGEEVDEGAPVRESVEEILAELPEAPPLTFSAPWGTGSQTLLEADGVAQMIVVGTARKHGLTRFLLGSTSLTVAMHASCPVVVVGPDGVPESQGRLVVGVDGSRDSSKALHFAMDAASRWGHKVVALATWNMAVVDGYVVTEPESEEWKRTVADMEARVAEVVEEVRSGDERIREVEVEIDVQHGRPLTALVAASQTADLVIVGSRGRGGVRGALLGSVSQGVLAEAHCPVAVITH
ncbi:Nucleotide-binding universal stress protein, UspA family [Kytococcus aerolatus]|uniref:Nucleotide-binding universal stress protein, UspA family n=1 Tax=Kytococcus aerolatus TaxID=592308 RepID=A0A212T8G6_9MICO|nr:universal stress protein [Kytococcus aerolatus]SNC62150.1 Nucleotide-binding universal stress protein, UspA family [Kytococcus aerolatus]